MPDVVYAPERIVRPLLRRGERGSGSFEEVSWERALSVVAARLGEIRSRYGTESILALGGSGSCRGALHNTGALHRRFLASYGSLSSPPSTYCSPQGNFSSQASMYANSFLFGTQLAGIDPATIRHSALVVLWGANIADTRFGAEWESRIAERRRAGVPVIVIDPRRSRTAELLGSEWVPVLPGGDAALMTALLFVLLERGMVDRQAISRYSVGFDELEGYVRGAQDGVPKDPAWAQQLCGVSPAAIRDLAVRYGVARPCALIPGLSIQRAVGGEEACRLAVALQVACGNAGVPGGSSGGAIWGRLPGPRCGRLSSAPQGLGELPGPLGFPVYEWADAVLLGKAGGYPADIRAIYNVGGNYVAQGSDVAKSIGAMRQVELAVCHELFLTPTARFCDIVLPVTTFLERNDIVFPADNYLYFSNRAISPVGECRDDYDILRDLASRLGVEEVFSEGRDEAAWLESFLRDSVVSDADELRRTGVFDGGDHERIGLAPFFADPTASPLPTPSGRIELASERYGQSGFPRHPTARGALPPPEYPLRLVTPHSRFYVNSQGSNIGWLAARQRTALWMHPTDAADAGIADQGEAIVESPRGRCRVTVVVTEGIMPGAVCLPVGRWPELGPDDTETNAAPNALTSTVATRPSLGSRTHTVFVRVLRQA
jgi:anaerobic dimethyl sulfoxide reductase subunit A